MRRKATEPLRRGRLRARTSLLPLHPSLPQSSEFRVQGSEFRVHCESKLFRNYSYIMMEQHENIPVGDGVEGVEDYGVPKTEKPCDDGDDLKQHPS